jgi:GSH-dependent disulfide-bond oxidoreductase
VARWFAEVNARPAAQRAEELKSRHAFKAEWDEEARRNMFRFLEASAGR